MNAKLVLVALSTAACLAAGPARGQDEPGDPNSVVVDLDAPNTALRSVVNYHAGRTWWYGARTVCTAPCTARVPLDNTYQIVGADMPASALFVLPANRSEVRIDVQPGNQTTHDVATFTAIAGGILACVGFVFLLSDVASGTTKLADPDMQAGLALSGAGVVGLGVSIPLLIANATTVRFP